MSVLNEEWFVLIEKSGPAGATAAEIVEHTGANLQVVHSWLSRWAGLGYLKHIPHDGHVHDPDRRRVEGKFIAGRPKGSGGRYVIGNKWWGDLRFVDRGGHD